MCVARDGASYTADQLDMMAAFADQSGLALHLAQSQADAVATLRELDVLSDRDRIARDLHDHVIQRLFAVGLSLQGDESAQIRSTPRGAFPGHSTTCRRWCRRSEPRSSTCTAAVSPGCASASNRRWLR